MLRLETIDQGLPDDIHKLPIEASVTEIQKCQNVPLSPRNLKRNFFMPGVHNGSFGVFEVCEVRCEVSEVKPHSKKKIFASGLG